MPTPDEIASRQFLIALRGYDRDEVSAFLQEVAEERRQLERRIAELEVRVEGETGDARHAFRHLGDETTRILVAAEEAATQMRDRADAEARETLDTARRSATQELDEARRTAQRELDEARRTAKDEVQEARRTAQEELERARNQADALVEDARRDARSAVDAADQRRAEIDVAVRELEAIRERLLTQLEETVTAVNEATAGLRVHEAGPQSDPGTAEEPPVPLPAAEQAAAVEGAAHTEPGPPTVEAVDDAASAATDGSAPLEEGELTGELAEPVVEAPDEPAVDEPVTDIAEPVAETAETVEEERSTAEPLDPARGDEPTVEETAEPAVASDGADAHPDRAADEPVTAIEDDRIEDTTEVEPTDDAVNVSDVGAPDLRERAISGIRPGMLRRLKRTLQDVQNGVLDAIRRTDGRGDPHELLPTDDDLAGLGSVGEAFLAEGYRAGIADGATLADVPPDESAADPSRVIDAATVFRGALTHEISASLEATLRAGIEADEDATSLSERVSEVFRDLKGPVAEATVEAGLVRTYELGVHDRWRQAGIGKRTWVLGEEPRCPENRCRGNADEGPVSLDEPFPSGEVVPPAHPGCTCVVAPA